MKIIVRRLANLMTFAVFFFINHTNALSEDTLERINLGYGNLRQITDDPKNPAPGLLSARYGFKGTSVFKPYLGTGLIYTLQQNEKGGNLTVSAGIAGQAGFSYLLDKNSSLNIDYKYFHIQPETSKPDSTPQSIGIGVEFKF